MERDKRFWINAMALWRRTLVLLLIVSVAFVARRASHLSSTELVEHTRRDGTPQPRIYPRDVLERPSLPQLLRRVDGQPSAFDLFKPQVPVRLWKGATWSGQMIRPKGMNRDKARDYTKQFYENMEKRPKKEGFGKSPTLVAGLWVPDEGIFFGTIPHTLTGTKGTDDDGAQVFEEFIKDNLKTGENCWLITNALRDREHAGTSEFTRLGAKYHAEDLACYIYEKWRRDQTLPALENQYPAGSYMFVYGEKPNMPQERFWPPCSPDDYPSAKITPTCTNTLSVLGITPDM